MYLARFCHFHSIHDVRCRILNDREHMVELVQSVHKPGGARPELGCGGAGGRSDGGVVIISWKLSSVAGNLDM